MHVEVLWSTGDWAEAVARLPAEGPLPCRTVLVLREHVAHCLRRELLRIGRAEVLAGTRFVPLLAAAVDVLHGAGVEFSAGEDTLRSARLRELFRTELPLRYFNLQSLRSNLGWNEAFARTIAQLEHAGLRPDELAQAADEPRLPDVAVIWRRLDEAAGHSWTSGRVFAEAAALLEASPNHWPFDGLVLAAVSAEMNAAQARFVRAVPGMSICIVAARPLREHYLERLEQLFGDACSAGVRDSAAPRKDETELDLLQSYLFERPDVLARPDRPRSEGPDGTVHLEEQAGVEAEVEAAADWVGRQIIEYGTPLEEIALLMPAMDPLAEVLVERLRRLPWEDGAMPVYVAGGVPVTSMAAGARTLAVVRALRAHLSAGMLADVLPALRTEDPERNHLSRGGAMDLAYSLGTIGGSTNRPADALAWLGRPQEREWKLEEQLEKASEAEGDEEQAGMARRARDLERLLRDLRAIRPALNALVEVARVVLANEPLAEVWRVLCEFLETWLLAPGQGLQVPSLLGDALRVASADAGCRGLRGHEALEFVEERLRSLRVPTGRFGEPAVYVGTLRDALGLRFRAVRIIGLSEGALPSAPREDPVLPETARRRLHEALLPSAADRALAQLHALDRIVRDAGGSVVLSAPRLTGDRVDREASSIFIEAAAALGRPERATGKRERVIPDSTALRRDAFAPAREQAASFRSASPLLVSAWQDRVASLRTGLPSAWRGDAKFDLERIETLTHCDSWGGLDGLIGSKGPAPAMRGVSVESPVSASRLRTLLECPHRFLFEHVLSWSEPAAPPSLREIEPVSYGGLFHRVAEQFYRAHGQVFGERQSTLESWLTVADELVGREFEEFCRSYPLVGTAVRRQQHERLRRDFRTFLNYDWNDGVPRQFVAAERPFGYPDALQIDVRDESLFVRGFIDRVDVEKRRTLVRDLKTGHPHPREGDEAEPDHVRDLQIAIYGMVARQLARNWEVPGAIAAAYTYADVRGESERSFRDDFPALQALAETWLATAARLLKERYFPLSPVEDDCKYCAFEPLCGDQAQGRVRRLLESSSGALAEFLAMKLAQEG